MVCITNLPVLVNDQDLDSEMQSRGFSPGPPAHVSEATLAADQDSYRRLRCRICGAKDRRCRFYSRGRRYLVIPVCAKCSHAEVP